MTFALVAMLDAEIKDRVFRLCNLTRDEVALLMKEVEHEGAVWRHVRAFWDT